MKKYQVCITLEADLYAEVIAPDIDTAEGVGDTAAEAIKNAFMAAWMSDQELTGTFHYPPSVNLFSVEELEVH